jgi:hypothetical protein
LLAIVLLFIFLFNLSGYFLYYKYFIYQSDKEAILQLENHSYKDSELIELKITLNLPYLTSQQHYERIDGQLQHKGIYYNYVARKVHNDTLYLRCRPNRQKTNLYRDLNEYASKVNDIPFNDKNGTSLKKVTLALEYVQTFLTYTVSYPGNPSAYHKNAICALIQESFISDSFKPPRHLA